MFAIAHYEPYGFELRLIATAQNESKTVYYNYELSAFDYAFLSYLILDLDWLLISPFWTKTLLKLVLSYLILDQDCLVFISHLILDQG